MRARTMMVTLAAATVLLAGCSPQEGTDMTPDQARDNLIALIESTAAELGGAWEDPIQPYPEGCTMSGGASGVRYNSGAGSAPSADPEVDAERVAEYWRSLGMEARVVLDPPAAVFATGGASTNISFDAGPQSSSILGSSVCVPGDPIEEQERNS
ncbi:hypothetical protein [Microbacterium sp. NPDC077184]|uniref:hypothetical protein n=1 Tax=Microbacterium sp. NPDC077184 TaxID=3154764 RepID=UPI00343E830F